MVTRSKQRIVRMALHASASSYTDEPGTLYLQPWRRFTPRWKRNASEDGSNYGDGKPNPMVVLDEELGCDLGDAMFGLATNDGTTVAAATDWDRDIIFSRAFGAAATAGGSAVAQTGDGTGTAGSGIIGVDDETKKAPGTGAAWIGDDTTAPFIMREVVANGVVGEFTADRAVPFLPVSAATVFGALTYVLTEQSDIERIFVDIEAGTAANGWRRKHFANFVESLTFDIPAKGEVEWDAVLQGNHADLSAAPAEPTLSPLSKGTGIRVMKSPWYIGDTEYCFMGGQIKITNTLRVLECTGGENGAVGHAVLDRALTMENVRFYLGASAKEVPHTGTPVSVDALASESTFDVGFQNGLGVTKGCYWRFPAMQFFNVSVVEDNGLNIVSCSAKATRSPNEANVPGVARLHVF